LELNIINGPIEEASNLSRCSLSVFGKWHVLCHRLKTPAEKKEICPRSSASISFCPFQDCFFSSYLQILLLVPSRFWEAALEITMAGQDKKKSKKAGGAAPVISMY